MARSKPLSSCNDLGDVIRTFLASPPEGTPVEIIEAFNAPGTRELLPPRLFQETVEQAPVAISITDPDARILYANAAFEALAGYRREEVIGQKESMLSSKSTPDSAYRDLWETIRQRRVWKGNLVNRRKNGEEYLAEITISPVLTAGNRIAYYLGMHRDITEMHQLEQRLQFQKDLTEAALDAAPVVVAIVNSNRKVLLDNHAYKALLGDFRGAEPADLFLHALERQIGLDLGSVCQGGKGFTNIEVRLDPPGSGSARWFACSGVRVAELDVAAQNYFRRSGETRCCLLLVANEVTASRKRINEARLNMIRASMTEQQMVHTMRESISGAVFKLRAPMNVLKAALAMPEPGDCQNSQRGVMQQVLESGDEAIEALNAALPDPAREQTSTVNINEVIEDVIKLSTDNLLASGVVVDWRPVPVLPAVTGRANALRGLCKYLIDNAIQALNESGSDYREMRLGTHLDGQDLVIEVMDNGPGIPEMNRLRVFEPFFCGWKQPRSHAGMGLTMAQEVVLGHGGNMEIDPDFLGGCRVLIRLPVNGIEGG